MRGGYSGSFGSSEGTPAIDNLVGGRHRNGNGRGHRPGDRHRRGDHRRCHHRHRRDDYDDCGKGDSVARGTMMLRLYTKPALLFGVGFFLVVNTGLVELNLEKRLFRRGGDGGSSRGGGDGSAAPAPVAAVDARPVPLAAVQAAADGTAVTIPPAAPVRKRNARVRLEPKWLEPKWLRSYAV